MTPKKAIELLTKEKSWWVNFADNDDAYWTAQEYLDAYELVIDALEKADKYRWHDLRENPADLPKEMEPGDDFSVDVLLAIRFDEDEPGDEYTYTVGYVNVINDDTFEWWACTDSSSHRIIKPSHVVKWRYID